MVAFKSSQSRASHVWFAVCRCDVHWRRCTKSWTPFNWPHWGGGGFLWGTRQTLSLYVVSCDPGRRFGMWCCGFFHHRHPHTHMKFDDDDVGGDEDRAYCVLCFHGSLCALCAGGPCRRPAIIMKPLKTPQIRPTPASHWKLQSLLPCIPEREVQSAAIKSACLWSLYKGHKKSSSCSAGSLFPFTVEESLKVRTRVGAVRYLLPCLAADSYWRKPAIPADVLSNFRLKAVYLHF